MKTKSFYCLLVAISMVMFFSFSASAQRYRGGGGYRGGYSHYNYGRSYYPSRPIVSVNIGHSYGYRPYSYYPTYSNPYSYVHFGPAFGFRLNVLPFGYYPFYYGGNPYYYYNGIYYRPYSGGGYEVTAPPLGATVKHLPAGTKVTIIDGVKYYELGGTFYQEEITEKNKLRYKVVGTDGVLNTANDAPTDSENAPAPMPENNNAPAVNNNPPQNSTVTPEIGARFDQLPADSKTVVINKQKYFLAPSGVYYQEVIDGNVIRYEVTGKSNGEQQ